MLKLLKWELSHTWISFVSVLGLFCLSLVAFYAVITEFIINDWFSSITIFTIISSLGALFFLAVLMVIQTFGKFLFGDMGHLLFCLPISLDKILLAKLFACMILIGVSALVIVNGFFIVFGLSDGATGISNLYISVFTFVEENLDCATIFTFLLSLVLNLFSTLIKVLLILSFLNVLHVQNFKLILGILLFIGINLVWGSFTSVFFKMGRRYIELGYDYLLFVIHCICDLTFALGGYFISRFLIKNHLELE